MLALSMVLCQETEVRNPKVKDIRALCKHTIIYSCLCLHVGMHRSYVCSYLCMYVCLYLCMHGSLSCRYVCMFVCVQAYTHIHTRSTQNKLINMYIYIHTHTHAHTYTVEKVIKDKHEDVMAKFFHTHTHMMH
jgi:hypothetical protein